MENAPPEPTEPAALDEKLTRRLASLSRLELSDEEVTKFTAQLGDVLGYINLLQEVDVSQVEPMTHPLELATPLREDRVKPSPVDEDGKPKVLLSAPEVLHDGFKVPPIL